MAPQYPEAEPVEFDKRTGGIKITLDKTFTLRHPSFGELRDLLVTAEKVDEETDAPAPVVGSLDVMAENIEWWRAAIKTLSGEEAPLVEACPTWLGGRNLITRATTHWLTVPTLAPGN